MGMSSKLKDAVYAVADAFRMVVYVGKDKKLSGEIDHAIGVLDLKINMPLKITNSNIGKDFVIAEVTGPGDLFFIVLVETTYTIDTTPNIHIFLCNKAKLSPTTEFPEKIKYITPEKLSLIYGPSVAHHVKKPRTKEKWAA